MSQETLTITLSSETRNWIQSEIHNGHFVSEDEAIRAGITLLRNEAEFEETMRVVAERYDEAHLHFESLIPVDQVIQNMEERHKRRSAQAS